MKQLLNVGILLLCLAAARANAQVWPGKQWAVATPESQGLSSSGLDVAAEYTMKHGSGSGCVIRHGRLMKEWGAITTRADIKSATRGTMGATALGLAVNDGLIKLDDIAQTHYPAVGTEKRENVARGWLGQITVRQSPDRYVIVLADPGWREPAGRDIVIRTQLPDAWTATDRLTGQSLGAIQNGLELAVPAGTIRLLQLQGDTP